MYWYIGLYVKPFLPNPKDLPEVNHKDNNPQNNNLSNLEWCTRKENLQQSYKTMSPVRNYRWTGTQQPTFKLPA